MASTAQTSIARPIAQIKAISASSSDDRFPATNILDHNPKSFWTSTGLYPQWVIFELPKESSIRKASIVSTGVSQFALEKCVDGKGVEFALVVESLEIMDVDDRIQRTIIDVTGNHSTRFVKLVVKKGSEFCSLRGFQIGE